MLNNRQSKIFDLLVKSEQYTTIADLATMFDVSQRTIQYDLEHIEDLQRERQFTLQRHKSYGVRIHNLQETLSKNDELIYTDVHLSKDERVLNIILKLFETSQPLTSSDLAQAMAVSRRTIVNDLKAIQHWLTQYQLELAYIKNKGFMITGDEEAYRSAYANRIQVYFKTMSPFITLDIFTDEELTKVRNTVIHTLTQMDYHLVQSAIDGLIYHLLIAIHRLKGKFSFDVPSEQAETLKQTYQFQIASQLKDNLEGQFNIKFPDSEAIFITLHLLGSKVSTNAEMRGTHEGLETVLRRFIYQVSAEIGIDMHKDDKLFDNLLLHMKPALHRLKYRMSQQNPLQEEIYQQYHQLVGIIESQITLLEQTYDITFTVDELAFIVIHFASSIERIAQHQDQIKVVLLCGSGIGTSQLLKNKLRNVYPEFDILDAYSIYQIDESQLLARGIDYIISTVPCEATQIPVIIVDPFLSLAAREKLNHIVNTHREQKVQRLDQEGYTLRQLLPIHRIQKCQQHMQRNEAIAHATTALIQDGIVAQDYVEEMIAQLEKFGPYMVISPNIALVHASTAHVLQDAGFSMCYFEHGVRFGHQHYDPVHIVIVLATKNPTFHLTALGQLSALITNDKDRQHILDGQLEVVHRFIDDLD